MSDIPALTPVENDNEKALVVAKQDRSSGSIARMANTNAAMDNNRANQMLSGVQKSFQSVGNQITGVMKEVGNTFSQVGNSVMQSTGSIGSDAFKAFMGPLGIAIDPIKNLAGSISSLNLGSKLSGLLSSTKELFSSDKEEQPSTPQKMGLFGSGVKFSGKPRVDQIKKFDPGAALLYEAIAGDDEKEGGGFNAGSLLAMAGLGGVLSSIAPVAAIAGALAWVAKDAVVGWLKSDEWGVSGVAGSLGAILGGTGEGWANAFANAGKWGIKGAMIGFGFGGPVGAIAGGLIGAAVGGVLGYIGGERIAQGIQAGFDWISQIEFVGALSTYMVEFFSSIWDFVVQPFKRMVSFIQDTNRLSEIWGDPEATMGEKIGQTLGNIIGMIWSGITGFVVGAVEGTIGLFKDFFIGKEDAEGKRTKKSLLEMFLETMQSLGSFLGDFVLGLFDSLKSSISSITANVDASDIVDTVLSGLTSGFRTAITVGTRVVDMVSNWFDENVKTPVRNFFGNMWTGITEATTGAINTAMGWIRTNVVNPVSGWFSNVKDGVISAFANAGDFVRGLWDTISESVTGLFQSIANVTQFGVASMGSIFRRNEAVSFSDFGRRFEALKEANDRGEISFKTGQLRRAAISAEDSLWDGGSGRSLSRAGFEANFHTGGVAPYEMPALLREDEEVLDPIASRQYRDLMSGRQAEIERDMRENERYMREMEASSRRSLTQAIERLIFAFENGNGNNGTVVQNNNVSRFSPANIMKGLVSEAD